MPPQENSAKTVLSARFRHSPDPTTLSSQLARSRHHPGRAQALLRPRRRLPARVRAHLQAQQHRGHRPAQGARRWPPERRRADALSGRRPPSPRRSRRPPRRRCLRLENRGRRLRARPQEADLRAEPACRQPPMSMRSKEWPKDSCPSLNLVIAASAAAGGAARSCRSWSITCADRAVIMRAVHFLLSQSSNASPETSAGGGRRQLRGQGGRLGCAGGLRGENPSRCSCWGAGAGCDGAAHFLPRCAGLVGQGRLARRPPFATVNDSRAAFKGCAGLRDVERV